MRWAVDAGLVLIASAYGWWFFSGYFNGRVERWQNSSNCINQPTVDPHVPHGEGGDQPSGWEERGRER